MKLFNTCYIYLGIILYWLLSSVAKAQVLPDTTLPVNSTINTRGSTLIINGGTQAGGNLFHSFEKFDLPTGMEALFNNNSTTQNIFTRVTGGVPSNIDGILRANGNTNLFFINPVGIIFGPNASLNIGGSFIGSTANSINFSDRTKFSATNPQPLLAINIPIGLEFGNNPGAIQLSGTGHHLSYPSIFSPLSGVGSSPSLQVQPLKNLALIGGNISLQGGNLTVPQLISCT